jgi:hypothetical protein
MPMGMRGQAERDGREVQLLVDEAEGLEEHEDESVAEAGEEGERGTMGLVRNTNVKILGNAAYGIGIRDWY